jgi:hypothetical protein
MQNARRLVLRDRRRRRTENADEAMSAVSFVICALSGREVLAPSQ